MRTIEIRTSSVRTHLAFGACYGNGAHSRTAYGSTGRRIRNLFEMKENMITPMRVVDTLDITRSVYFNFRAAARRARALSSQM